MIFIRCGVAMHGATVMISDARQAIMTAETLQGAGVEIESYANDKGEAITMFALKLMAVKRPILINDA